MRCNLLEYKGQGAVSYGWFPATGRREDKALIAAEEHDRAFHFSNLHSGYFIPVNLPGAKL